MTRFPFPGKLLILALVLTTALLSGCSRMPLAAVSPDSAPLFTDDLDLDSLKKAVQTNLDYLRRQPPEKAISLGNQTFPLNRLTRSLELFQDILAANPSPAELDRLVRQHYDIFQATGSRGFNPGRRMLVTGYFQPVFAGSLSRKAPFLYPLYSVPDDLVRSRGPEGKGQSFKRLANGRTIQYWNRREIERDNRAAGHELVWLKDPFDAFVLHVQGSGLIRLRDGTVRGVHYAAKNGHPYRSIGKHMVETGRIPLETASLETIQDYIAAHPEERDEILHHNPSFIFFDWTDTHGAIGNLGEELTAGRSIAVDQSCFPAGGLAFLQTRKPTRVENRGVAWKPLHRFVVVQDTGSAIRGPGRVDLFWGAGSEAGFEAGQMKEKGTLYFLVIKEASLAGLAQN
ncbi:MAG: MltA domain-containing protein [Desulfobulbaceae bacterium]|nr:MltA domain-containing protein [Desulfobulbaceae bacterium]